jgi:isoleucyl-tRNA synthetase
VKVRQPLPAVLLVTRHRALRDHAELLEQIADELNVKAVRFLDDPGGYVTFEVKPRFDTLGPRFGPRVQEVASAVRALDPAATVEQLQRTGQVLVAAGGEDLVLTAADLEARMHEAGGYAAEGASGEFAILETALTPELEMEGRARELVHQVQNLRREAGLAIDDRIVLLHDDGLNDLLRVHGDYVRRETLAEATAQMDGPVPVSAAGQSVYHKDLRLDGEEVRVGIARIRS